MSNFNEDIKFNNDMLEILDESRENFIPTMLSGTAKFLYSYVANLNCKNILEIGTALGYSGILMLKANKNANLTTIELNEERFVKAKANFEKFNLLNRTTLINDDGINAVENLKEQGEKFDFIFLDGPKGQYKKQFEAVEGVMSDNCVIIIDDVMFMYATFKEGEVAHKHRAMIKKLREFVKSLLNNKNYESKLYNIDEGIIVAKKIK